MLYAESDAVFLQGLLEGVARIEAESYQLLQQLGATPVKKVANLLQISLNLTPTPIGRILMYYVPAVYIQQQMPCMTVLIVHALVYRQHNHLPMRQITCLVYEKSGYTTQAIFA